MDCWHSNEVNLRSYMDTVQVKTAVRLLVTFLIKMVPKSLYPGTYNSLREVDFSS